MMNKQQITRIVLIVSSFLLMLTGCKSTEIKQNTIPTSEHVFEEKEIAVDSYFQMQSLSPASNDQYIASYFDPKQNSYRLGRTDRMFTEIHPIHNDVDKLLHASALPEIENPAGSVTFGYQLVYDVDQNDHIYVLQYEATQQVDRLNPFGKTFIYVYDKDGMLTKQIAVEKSTQPLPTPPSKLIVQKDRFILVAETGIQIADSQGRTLDERAVPSDKVTDVIDSEEKVIPIGMITDADMMQEDELVFIQDRTDHKYLVAYHLLDKQIIWEQELKENFIPVSLQVHPEKQLIYLTSSEKILAFNQDGSEHEEWIDFNQYESGAHMSRIFNGENRLIPGILLFEAPDLMYLYLVGTPLNPGIKKVYAYRSLMGDEREKRLAELEQNKADKTTINVFVPFVEPAFEQKIAQFQSLNPDLNVKVNYFKADVDEFNPVDYLQYVSLQLLTNKSDWDVMAVQMLPYREYARKGYFADLNEIESMQWTTDRKRFVDSILDSVSMDGKLMLIPARIMMSVNLVDAEASKQLKTFKYTWDDLIQAANTATANSSELKPWSFFGANGYQFGAMYDELIHSYQNDIMSAKNEEEQERLLSQLLDTMKAIGIPDHHVQAQQKPMFHLMPFIAPLFPNYVDKIGTETVLMPGPASPVTGQHSFTLQEGYALNSGSQVKEEALRFMVFMAEHAESNNILFKESFDNMKEKSGDNSQRIEAIDRLQEIVEHLSALRDLDYTITDAIAGTAEQYVNGITDKKSAIRTMMDKLWLYENE